jgi:mRNA-degrading endonuclease RelE of RelBE toxin-antitoxin system
MGAVPKLAISDTFLKALSKLPRDKQKKVHEFTTKFRENPTSSSINYESLHNMKDPKVRTVRIDLAYRAVIVHPPKGDVYLLVWVDQHDEAMDWAKNKTFDVNAVTGALQVVDTEEIKQVTETIAQRPSTPAGLFSAWSDDQLASTGLPAILLPAVRAIVDDGALDKLQPHVPREAFEALYMLACGYDLESAIRESSRPSLKPPPVVDTEDFAAALQNPVTKSQFRLVENDADLLEMLEASLSQWRVFLHPNQESLVKASFKGSARVLGGAGTGKTVVAMHRARELARRYPEGKILFTTYNRNLASNIGLLLDELCGPERDRIKVSNIHAWAIAYHSKEWGKPSIVDSDTAKACWDTALAQGGALDWTKADYEDEWNSIVQFHGISTRDEYLKVSRAGCKKKLKRLERAEIWEGLEAYREALTKRGLVGWADVVRRVRQDLETKGDTPFRAVVVDEAQDIDAEQWRLIRLLAPREPDSLFIAGDAHQRIYGKPVTLSLYGIDIRGRSRRLKINYRTTEQILRWATQLLDGLDVDDLDGGADSTVGYKSLYGGPVPLVERCETPEKEEEILTARVHALIANGCPAEEIAVVARHSRTVKKWAYALSNKGTAAVVLDGNATGPGVRVATMHRVKGLDFTHVVMQLPKGAREAVDPRERSLLYVAATRARKTLTVLAAG